MKSFAAGILVLVLLSADYLSAHDVNLQFYMHDIVRAQTPSSVAVAAANGNFTDPGFGRTFVFDDPLTEGADPNSPKIGRGQGVYSVASQTSADLLLVFTAVLHTPEHNGSTICLHGSDRTGLFEREIAVVGGTGHFRFARGVAVIQTISFNVPNAVLKFNVKMRL